MVLIEKYNGMTPRCPRKSEKLIYCIESVLEKGKGKM